MKALKQHLSLTTLCLCTLFSACQKHDNNQTIEATKAASKATQTSTAEISALPQDCKEIDTNIKILEETVIVVDLNDLNLLLK